mmetsp:Transcript_2245/g.3733  ORF Transcript_2245/g.3733 Transcript_2245/m.3733 type:complete len:209 (+) Transcript_2245:481-1107(+)
MAFWEADRSREAKGVMPLVQPGGVAAGVTPSSSICGCDFSSEVAGAARSVPAAACNPLPPAICTLRKRLLWKRASAVSRSLHSCVSCSCASTASSFCFSLFTSSLSSISFCLASPNFFALSCASSCASRSATWLNFSLSCSKASRFSRAAICFASCVSCVATVASRAATAFSRASTLLQLSCSLVACSRACLPASLCAYKSLDNSSRS